MLQVKTQEDLEKRQREIENTTEENNRKLEKEASQFAALEETIRKSSKIYHTNKFIIAVCGR